MTNDASWTDKVAAALRGLPTIEREVLLAMLDEEATYLAVASRLGIDPAVAEQAFAAALVGLADALDAQPSPSARQFVRGIAAAARLARRLG